MLGNALGTPNFSLACFPGKKGVRPETTGSVRSLIRSNPRKNDHRVLFSILLICRGSEASSFHPKRIKMARIRFLMRAAYGWALRPLPRISSSIQRVPVSRLFYSSILLPQQKFWFPFFRRYRSLPRLSNTYRLRPVARVP